MNDLRKKFKTILIVITAAGVAKVLFTVHRSLRISSPTYVNILGILDYFYFVTQPNSRYVSLVPSGFIGLFEFLIEFLKLSSVK